MAQCLLMKVQSGLAEHYSLFETPEIWQVVDYFASVLVKLKGTIYVFYGCTLNINISSYFYTSSSSSRP